MPKMTDAIRAATNRERVRNMKAICLHCRNGDPVEYQKEPVSNIGYWAHGPHVCAAGPIRDRAMSRELAVAKWKGSQPIPANPL